MNWDDSFRVHAFGGVEGLDVLICLPFADAGLPHGFTLRWRRAMGGGKLDPFGLRHRGDLEREELRRLLGFEHLASMRQLHGEIVQIVSEPQKGPVACDGLLTLREGLGLLVQTADCVPLLLWDARQKAVGAVHAGWRGTLAGIAARAVGQLESHFGSRPEDLHVTMGPSIGPCCYEVGDEVAHAFTEVMPRSVEWFRIGSRGRKNLDLVQANADQLADLGVPAQQIFASGLCSSCQNDLLYSYRREGESVGTLYAVIGVSTPVSLQV